MDSTVFVECCVVTGHRWFILRRESAVPAERLVADGAGFAMQFGREESARAWAKARGPVSDRPAREVDLDAVLRVCHQLRTGPTGAVPFEPAVLWEAWDFLGRVGALEERPVDTHGELDVINAKLGFAMALRERPELRSSTAAPTLSEGELRHLASLLREGTLALVPRLSPTGGLPD